MCHIILILIILYSSDPLAIYFIQIYIEGSCVCIIFLTIIELHIDTNQTSLIIHRNDQSRKDIGIIHLQSNTSPIQMKKRNMFIAEITDELNVSKISINT